MIKTSDNCVFSKADLRAISLVLSDLVHCFGIGAKVKNLLRLIARKSALEKTQLSDVLITDNLF